MYDILISGHYPSINEKDIARDAIIKIFLDKEIDTTSIKQNNVIVTDYLYNPVKGFIGWEYTNHGTPSGIANILTFTPDSYLDPETTYIVTIPKYPDSIRSLDNSFIQQTHTFRFQTGIKNNNNSNPTFYERLLMDLEAAISRNDWAEAARIQAILNGLTPESSGIIDIILPEHLVLEEHNPVDMESDIDIEYKLRFIKLTFNDEMLPISGIDYSSFINVTTKNVLE